MKKDKHSSRSSTQLMVLRSTRVSAPVCIDMTFVGEHKHTTTAGLHKNANFNNTILGMLETTHV